MLQVESENSFENYQESVGGEVTESERLVCVDLAVRAAIDDMSDEWQQRHVTFNTAGDVAISARVGGHTLVLNLPASVLPVDDVELHEFIRSRFVEFIRHTLESEKTG